MASTETTTKAALRRTWFQVHKWIGLILAILIIPLALSGSILVWDEWVGDVLHPERRVETTVTRAPSFYADAARGALAANEALAMLSYPDGTGPVVASAARGEPGAPPAGRPVRTQLFLEPASGVVLDRASSDSGFLRTMHMLHGSLLVPGMGRQIVGWLGIAMLISSLTGLWLWWPFSGGVARGFRWQRSATTSGNLHHQFGFWIALPLFVLSLTGAWISFPAFFAKVSGTTAPGGPGGPGGRGGAPLAQPHLSPDQALAAAAPYATGALRTIAWPTRPKAAWTVTYARGTGTAEVTVTDSTGTATAPDAARPETVARLMRRIHDGTRMGPLWQTIIFLGGLIPAGLAVTGVLMWLADRKRRAARRLNRAGREAMAS